MTLAVDSNVLFDILLDDAEHAARSVDLLTGAVEAGQVVICPVVYAELAARFDDYGDLDRFLRDLGIQLADFDVPGLREAGRAWREYTQRRSTAVQCAQCGDQFEVACRSCQSAIRWRQHLVADFLIGGHAASQAEALLTRDRGYYRIYFPALRLWPD